jgi:hypothetical protein
MPISILTKNGLRVPMFYCDHCGDCIGTHEEGSALYDPNGKKEKRQVFYAHTGICHNRVEERENANEWTTLGQYLLLLCSNVDIGPDKLNDLEERYAGDQPG